MSPSILDRLRTALKRSNSSTEQLAAAVDDARRAQADATHAVERQVAAVAAGYLDPDAARAAARAKLADLRADAEDADAILAEAERRHAAALDGEEQGRRRGLYESARAEAEAAAADLAKTYPKLSGDLLALLGRLARAQQAVALVNDQLPDGVAPLVDPEMVARGAAGLPREVISDREVEAWSRMDLDTPLDEPFQSQIYDVGEGWGKRGQYEGGDLSMGEAQALYRLRRFRRVEYRDAVVGELPAPLASSIYLPNIRGTGAAWGEAWGHRSNTSLIGPFGGADHVAVLSRLAEMDSEAVALPAKVERPVKVEWTLLAEVVPQVWERPIDPLRSWEAKTGSRFGASPYATPGARAGRR